MTYSVNQPQQYHIIHKRFDVKTSTQKRLQSMKFYVQIFTNCLSNSFASVCENFFNLGTCKLFFLFNYSFVQTQLLSDLGNLSLLAQHRRFDAKQGQDALKSTPNMERKLLDLWKISFESINYIHQFAVPLHLSLSPDLIIEPSLVCFNISFYTAKLFSPTDWFALQWKILNEYRFVVFLNEHFADNFSRFSGSSLKKWS